METRCRQGCIPGPYPTLSLYMKVDYVACRFDLITQPEFVTSNPHTHTLNPSLTSRMFTHVYRQVSQEEWFALVTPIYVCMNISCNRKFQHYECSNKMNRHSTYSRILQHMYRC